MTPAALPAQRTQWHAHDESGQQRPPPPEHPHPRPSGQMPGSAAMDCEDVEEARDPLRHKDSVVTARIYRRHFSDK